MTLGFAPVLLLLLASARTRRAPSLPEALLVSTGGGDAHAAHPTLGLLAALGSGAAYALSADLGGSLTQGHDALTVTTCTIAVVVVVLTPGGLGVALLTDSRRARPTSRRGP